MSAELMQAARATCELEVLRLALAGVEKAHDLLAAVGELPLDQDCGRDREWLQRQLARLVGKLQQRLRPCETDKLAEATVSAVMDLAAKKRVPHQQRHKRRGN